MQIGYARVSTTDQSLDVQLDQLVQAGCERVFSEKLSGTTAARPQLQECLLWAREGDTLVITRLDRLARSITDLCNIGEKLRQKGVALRILDQAIDTSTTTGRLMFGMLGVIAQFETEVRADRQREGIAKARQKGIVLGRRPAISEELAVQLRRDREEGRTIKQLGRIYNMSQATVYRYLKEEDAGVEV
jgi:DNA invertase Pin-like site-specific DNA recombinase